MKDIDRILTAALAGVAQAIGHLADIAETRRLTPPLETAALDERAAYWLGVRRGYQTMADLIRTTTDRDVAPQEDDELQSVILRRPMVVDS